MDIYTDYGNWKFENHEFISQLVKNKSKAIARFTPVIAVVDYLYDQVTNQKKLSDDEEVIFSTGFDYIYDQFLFIKTLLEYRFNNDYKELDKFSKTINLLLYINEFQSEALEYEQIAKSDIKLLDNLEEKVNACLDKKVNAPDEYFQILNEITHTIFEKNNLEVHTIDQIFYEIAMEYNIYEEDDYNIYNTVLNKKINETKRL